MNSPTHATFTPHHNQRGAATIESAVMVILLLTMMLGVFQGLLAYRAKITLNHAVTEAVRTGAVQHAQSVPMIDSISEQLSPLYGGWGTGGARGLTEAIAKSKIDIANPVLNDGAGLQLHILSPTVEAFDAFGEPNENNVIEIQNHHLKHLPRDVDATAGVNIQDANLLKVHVTYGYKLTVPIIDKIIAKAGNVFDPSKSAYYSADPPRLPLQATAVARMHTAARKDDSTLSLDDDLATVTARVAPPGTVPPDDDDGSNNNGNNDNNNNNNGNNGNNGNQDSDATDNLTDDPDAEEEPLCEADDNHQPASDDRGFWGNLYDHVSNALGVARDFVRGIWAGLKSQASDVWDIVTSPIETGKGLLALAQAMIDKPQETLAAIGQAIGQDLSALINCGSYDRGRLLGEYVSPAFFIKFATRLARFGGDVSTDDLALAGRQTNQDLHVECSGGPNSFVAGTLVWTPDGLTPIENVIENQQVHSRNEFTFHDQQQLVGGVTNRISDHYYQLYTEQDVLHVTAEHPLWVQGKGWVEAEKVARYDVVATATGDTIVLSNIKTEEPVKVYNFSVENTPNYFVGVSGIWVHNQNVSIPCRIPWAQNVSILGSALTLPAIKRNEIFGSSSGSRQRDLRDNLLDAYPILRNLDAENGNRWEAHHIIPFSFSHPLLIALDFDVNSIHNGIPLPRDSANTLSATHRGNHVGAYNDALEEFLTDIDRLRGEGLSRDAARDAIIDGIENMRQHLADADVQLNMAGNDPSLITIDTYRDVFSTPLDLARDRL